MDFRFYLQLLENENAEVYILQEVIQSESIDNVWTVLTDFDKYSEWSEFPQKVEIIPDSSEPKVGDKVILHFRWIGSNKKLIQQKLVLKEFDIVSKRLAWGATIGLPFLLKAYQNICRTN